MINKDTFSNVVGNVQYHDDNSGFSSEIKHIVESYASESVNLMGRDMESILSSPTAKQEFVGSLCESMTNSPLFTAQECANSPFYSNYNERVEQLINNSMDQVAKESAMLGYAPIVAYNPFFIKKQWIDCVFKDVLMTEIPKTPVINMGFEKNYLKDLEGNEYPLPEALYDDEIFKKLYSASTGAPLKDTPIDITTCKGLSLINATYIDGYVPGDMTVELTPDIAICKVVATKTTGGGGDVEIPCNITTDVTTHNFVGGKIKFEIKDTHGVVQETIEDEIVGKIDFDAGTITAMSTSGKVKKIVLKGKVANRWNQRSLEVVRRVNQIQKVMPESGPRLNSAITIEDAADALATQNIDQIAYYINIMGSTLANLEDGEIWNYLKDSFETQKKADKIGVKYDELGNTSYVVEGTFNALPYDTYVGKITDWMKDSREYFERVLAQLKVKLRSSNMLFVAVAHPNVIRFLQDGINWVFNDDTQISGVKLNYNFGIYTTAQDRVHIVTTMRINEEDGIRIIGIPLTQELVTFKHYKYNVVIDRNYRNPVYTLTPNILCTQRTLTFDVLPVQGKLAVKGRELFSPETLKR